MPLQSPVGKLAYFSQVARCFMKWLMILLGLLALLAGAVTFWLPIPIGLPLLLLGLYVLLKHSKVARQAMARALKKSTRVKVFYRKLQSLRKGAREKIQSRERENSGQEKI